MRHESLSPNSITSSMSIRSINIIIIIDGSVVFLPFFVLFSFLLSNIFNWKFERSDVVAISIFDKEKNVNPIFCCWELKKKERKNEGKKIRFSRRVLEFYLVPSESLCAAF